MIGRPKIKNKKKNTSLSINIELDDVLTNFLQDKNMTKSQYVEYLIKQDIQKREKDEIL
jgi:hypothetical protein